MMALRLSGSSVESDDIDNESDGEEESMDNSDEEEVDMFPEADEDDELAAEENPSLMLKMRQTWKECLVSLLEWKESTVNGLWFLLMVAV